MLTLSATDLAIRIAAETGTLRVAEQQDHRFGGSYWTISDDHGLIEIALTAEEAEARVAAKR